MPDKLSILRHLEDDKDTIQRCKMSYMDRLESIERREEPRNRYLWNVNQGFRNMDNVSGARLNTIDHLYVYICRTVTGGTRYIYPGMERTRKIEQLMKLT